MNKITQLLRNYVTTEQAFGELESWLDDYLSQQFDISLGERKLNHKAAALLGYKNYNQFKANLNGHTNKLSPVAALTLLYSSTAQLLKDAYTPERKREIVSDYVTGVLDALSQLNPAEHDVIQEMLEALNIDSYADGIGSIEDIKAFIQSTGLAVHTHNEVWFSTDQLAINHQPVNGVMYATVTAFNRNELHEQDMQVLTRQVNLLGNDSDLRGKYDENNVVNEFVDNWLWPKSNGQVISYSATFRGRMAFEEKPIRSIIVIDAKRQTIQAEVVLFDGIKTMYQLAKCDHLEWITLSPSLTLAFDGEAKLKPTQQPVFYFNGNAIIGNAILIRSNEKGDTLDSTEEDLQFIQGLVKF